jgi:hypothetical protein
MVDPADPKYQQHLLRMTTTAMEQVSIEVSVEESKRWVYK